MTDDGLVDAEAGLSTRDLFRGNVGWKKHLSHRRKNAVVRNACPNVTYSVFGGRSLQSITTPQIFVAAIEPALVPNGTAIGVQRQPDVSTAASTSRSRHAGRAGRHAILRGSS